MKIIKDLNSDRLERKLPNGLLEVKDIDCFGIKHHYFLNKNKYIVGEYKKFFANNILFECIQYRNSRKHGIHKKYNHDGTIHLHREFKNGRLHGDYIQYNHKGKITLHEVYKEGKMVKKYV